MLKSFLVCNISRFWRMQKSTYHKNWYWM